MSAYRLVADVGGTNVRFALVVPDGGLKKICEYPVEKFLSFDDALNAYRKGMVGALDVKACAIAAAGPVSDGFAKLTNNTWSIDGKEVAKVLNGASVILVNDLEAVAAALPHLGVDDLQPIGPPMPAPLESRTMLALNVGTGFGAASVIKRGGHWWTCSGEPGHIRLGAVDERERSLLPEGASVESVLSGSGVVALYNRLAEKDGFLNGKIESAAAVFSRASCDEAASATVEIFTNIVGRVAGDLVLAAGAWGGVYLSGSVAHGWFAVADSLRFRSEFERKGPMRALMQEVPTAIIRHENASLFGLSILTMHQGLRE